MYNLCMSGAGNVVVYNFNGVIYRLDEKCPDYFKGIFSGLILIFSAVGREGSGDVEYNSERKPIC